jgi:hypothetical protein
LHNSCSGILIRHMLPKHKATPGPQQLPYLPHHTPHIPHRTQYLNTQNGIHTPLLNPLTSQNLAVLNSTGQKLILTLETHFLKLGRNFISVERIGFDGVDKIYSSWIVAVDLVSRSRTQFEDFAMRRANEGGDAGGVFVRDETIG